MKVIKCCVIAVLFVVMAIVLWQVALYAYEPPNRIPSNPKIGKPVKSYEMTELELEAYVQRRIATCAVREMHDTQTEVVHEKHWHVAIFDGIKYHVYTGPGIAHAVWKQ